MDAAALTSRLNRAAVQSLGVQPGLQCALDPAAWPAWPQPPTQCRCCAAAQPAPAAQGSNPIYNLLPDILSGLSTQADLAPADFQVGTGLMAWGLGLRAQGVRASVHGYVQASCGAATPCSPHQLHRRLLWRSAGAAQPLKELQDSLLQIS